MRIQNKEIEHARSLYYYMFGALFGFIDNEKQIKELKELISLFVENPMDESSINALHEMQNFLNDGGLKALKEESDYLFYSPESSYIPMSASYYDEGRDDGKKRVEAAGLLFGSKFRKNEIICGDSEDHVAFLFNFMYQLTKAASNGDKESFLLSIEVFKTIINYFADELTISVFEHKSSCFYKNSAIVLKSFIEFERAYLDLPAPEVQMGKERDTNVIKKDRKAFVERVKRNLDEIRL